MNTTIMEGTNMSHDYSEFQSSSPGDNLMARLEGLAQEQLDAEARLSSLEAQVDEAKAVVRRIKENDLPNLLDEAQLGDSKIVTPNGIEIAMKEEIRGSIPKGKEKPAHDWLEENDNGGLIKRTVTITFSKDEESWAAKFARDCANRKKPLNLEIKRAVHISTLRSFVKECMANGIPIPLQTFGVFRQRFTKVKVKT